MLENHKKQLQILQWQRGMGKEEKREGEETWWVLKSPCHILCGELLSLLERFFFFFFSIVWQLFLYYSFCHLHLFIFSISYPDATFVWTHRFPFFPPPSLLISHPSSQISFFSQTSEGYALLCPQFSGQFSLYVNK